MEWDVPDDSEFSALFSPHQPPAAAASPQGEAFVPAFSSCWGRPIAGNLEEGFAQKAAKEIAKYFFNKRKLPTRFGWEVQTVEKPFFAVNLTLSVRAYALPARCDYVGIAHMGEPRAKLFHITILFYEKKDFLSKPLPVGQHGKARRRGLLRHRIFSTSRDLFRTKASPWGETVAVRRLMRGPSR